MTPEAAYATKLDGVAARYAERHGRRHSGGPGTGEAAPLPPTHGGDVPAQIFIVYENAARDLSERTVTVFAIWETDGALYFKGRCHLAGEPRTFRADRIIELMCLVTGEAPKDAQTWLRSHALMGHEDERQATNRALQNCRDELVMLAWFGHADGRLSGAEIEVAIDHVMMACDWDIDRDQVAEKVRRLAPCPDDLPNTIRRLSARPDRWAPFAASVRRLIQIDGFLDIGEQLAWADMQALFDRAVRYREAQEAKLEGRCNDATTLIVTLETDPDEPF